MILVLTMVWCMRLCVVIMVVNVFNKVTKTNGCVLFSMYMHYKSPFLLNIHKLNYSKDVHIDISYIVSVMPHVERITDRHAACQTFSRFTSAVLSQYRQQVGEHGRTVVV